LANSLVRFLRFLRMVWNVSKWSELLKRKASELAAAPPPEAPEVVPAPAPAAPAAFGVCPFCRKPLSGVRCWKCHVCVCPCGRVTESAFILVCRPCEVRFYQENGIPF
jgi:hypothetical protein